MGVISMKFLIFAFSILFTLSVGNCVQAEIDDEMFRSYFMVKQVKIKEVIPTAAEKFSAFLPENGDSTAPSDSDNLNSSNTGDTIATFTSVDIDALILIGKKIFDIVKQGAPVVNIKKDALAVVPKGIHVWTELSGWKEPITKVFSVQMFNGFNQAVVDMRLKVSAVHGGSYQNIGSYLSNVVLIPSYVKASWGITLDVWTEAREPVNMGSTGAPVAGLGLDVHYRAKTWLSELSGVSDFFLQGDGQISMVK